MQLDLNLTRLIADLHKSCVSSSLCSSPLRILVITISMVPEPGAYSVGPIGTIIILPTAFVTNQGLKIKTKIKKK